MMKIILTSVAVVAALVGSVATVRADATSAQPAKAAAYTTLSGVTVTNSDTVVAQLQILKGKKRRVLEVDAVIAETDNVVGALAISARINGIVMQPTLSLRQVADCNNANIACSLTGRFWADLDAFEANYPGMFIGQPLNIDIYGITGAGPGVAAITARARLVKK